VGVWAQEEVKTPKNEEIQKIIARLEQIEVKESKKYGEYPAIIMKEPEEKKTSGWKVVGIVIWIIAFLILLALVIWALVIAYRGGGTGVGPRGPTGPQGSAGPPGPTGPAGNGSSPLFTGRSTGTSGYSVKLTLGSSYTIPGLMLGSGVCYTGTSQTSADNCFLTNSYGTLGVTQISGSDGYGFYNNNATALAIELDLSMSLTYTYASGSSYAGSTLNIQLQPYVLTWSPSAGSYVVASAYPSSSYTFVPLPPSGQYGGVVNIAYSTVATLPGATASCTSCHPDLFTVVVNFGGTGSGNWLMATASSAIQLQVTAG
jgi:hypothetical protein